MSGIFVEPAAPARVKLSRKGGYRMPPNTTKVARPSVFGNPWTVERIHEEMRKDDPDVTRVAAQQAAVDIFRDWLAGKIDMPRFDDRRKVLLAALSKLRGRNVACFCKLDEPCHGDVLLEMANAKAEAS